MGSSGGGRECKERKDWRQWVAYLRVGCDSTHGIWSRRLCRIEGGGSPGRIVFLRDAVF